MLIAVTGATGFVGRRIAAALLARGHRVRALTRNPARAAAAFGPESRPGPELVAGDVGDAAALARLVSGAAAVIHLVGIIAQSGRATFQAVHVAGTAALLAAARAAGVGRFVHMSALNARPDRDATPYHRTKWQAEEQVRGSGLSHAILRPSVINGPGSVPIGTVARLHRWSPAIPVFGDGSFPMQPVWIEDVALAFARAAADRAIMGAFELGGPAVLTYEEFLLAIGRASGHPRPLVHVPLALARTVAAAMDWLGPAAPITTDQLQMLVEGSATPANAIESVFGIRPLSFEAGLARYLSRRG